eukprot:1297944-Alexandrium_andersonii.AAC.1
MRVWPASSLWWRSGFRLTGKSQMREIAASSARGTCLDDPEHPRCRNRVGEASPSNVELLRA